MKPNTNKSKTAKAGRRFRGLEVAQAALLLVLGVVVAMAMYFVMMNMLMMAPVPDVQVDPYNSFIISKGYVDDIYIQLVFGRVGHVTLITINNDALQQIASCFHSAATGYKLAVAPGARYSFQCGADVGGLTRNLIIKVVFDDNKIVYIRWVPS